MYTRPGTVSKHVFFESVIPSTKESCFFDVVPPTNGKAFSEQFAFSSGNSLVLSINASHRPNPVNW